MTILKLGLCSFLVCATTGIYFSREKSFIEELVRVNDGIESILYSNYSNEATLQLLNFSLRLCRIIDRTSLSEDVPNPIIEVANPLSLLAPVRFLNLIAECLDPVFCCLPV